MKNRKLLCLLLALLTLLSFASCSGGLLSVSHFEDITPASVDKTEECTPLLYKVTDKEGVATLYLLGSIHVGDERTQAMPDYIMNAYRASSYICVEADIVAYETDFEKQQADLEKLRCEEGKTIKDHISKLLYNDAKALLQSRGLYNAVYDIYGPTLWASLVDEAIRSYTELESEYGVDRFFIHKANADGKEIKEVESVDFQNDMMLSFSDDINEALIASSVYYAEESVNSLVSMYETWLGGDEAEIEEMLRLDYSEVTEEEKSMWEDYNKTMLTDRNLGMADKAEEYLAEGGTGFYIVGTAHVVGEGALVELLRDRGYIVEKVS